MAARSVRLVSARIARWGAALLLLVGLVVLPGLPHARAAVPSGNQLRLDGVDDYATIPDNSSLDLGDEEGEDFTIEAFIYVPNETSDVNQVIFWKQYAYALTIVFHSATPDLISFRTWGLPMGTGDQLYNTTNLEAGWHHVAAVYANDAPAPSDRLAIYLDGAEFALTTAVGYAPGIYGSSNALSVGANAGAAPFHGWLEEARFSSTVRYSGAYAVPSSPFAPDGDTRALWHFDDAACASSFIDSSVNGNTLAAQGGATTGPQGAAAPTLQFSSSTYAVAEADGSATVTVTRTGDPLPVVGVDHTTTDGTASAGSDYTDTDGSLSFACGDMEETFSVPITADVLVEPDETVSLGLTTPTGGASLGSPSSATLTIQDEDVTPPDTSITEGPTGATKDTTPTFAFTSTEAGSTFECRVDSSPYAACTSPHTTAPLLDGTHTFYVRAIDAADNPDPSAASRSFTVDTDPPETYLTGGPTGPTNDPTPTFTFSADEPSSTFECRVDDDPFTICTSPHTTPTLPDDSYGFSVRAIDEATNVDATPANFSFSVDTAPPSIRFQRDGSAIQEDAGTVELLVVRDGYEGVAISADFEVTGGTATGGSDYTVTPGTVDLDAGELNESITVTIADDPTAEGPETFEVTLSNPSGGAVLGSPSSTTLTIGASDQQPDALISNLVASQYIGDGIYNIDGAGQTKKATQVPGKKRIFYVRIANDGTTANTFKVKGTASPKGATVKYFLNATALNITADMLSKAGYEADLDAGTWETIKVVIKLKDTAVPGTKKTASVTASWAGDGVFKDVVKAVVKVKG